MSPQGKFRGVCSVAGVWALVSEHLILGPDPKPPEQYGPGQMTLSESQMMLVATSCGFCEQNITCVCVVLDDFELSNYHLSLPSLWLLHHLPEGVLLLGSARDLSPPLAYCEAHIFLRVLCIADSTLLISACRRGHRTTSLEHLTVYLSTCLSLHTPPHLCFFSSCRYQIGNGWPDLCKYWGSKQTGKETKK